MLLLLLLMLMMICTTIANLACIHHGGEMERE